MFKTLSSIYMVWILPAIAVFYLPVTIFQSRPLVNTIVILFLGFFMILAVYMSMRIIQFDNTYITKKRKPRILFFGMSLILWLVLYYAERKGQVYPGITGIIGTANLLVAAGFLGKGMAIAIKRPAEMIPVCMAAASADIFSIWMGPTKKIADTIQTFYESGMVGPPPLADFFLIKIPVPGIATLIPLFGVTDWILVAFISSVMLKLNMNDNITGKSLNQDTLRKSFFFYFPLAAAGLFFSVFLAHISGLFIPGMPVMVLFLLPYMMFNYPESRKLIPSDILLTITFPCLIFAVIYFFYR